MLEEIQVKTSFNYALEVLLGREETSLGIMKYVTYSSTEEQTQNCVRLCIVPSGFFGGHYGKPASLPGLPLKEIEGVPLLYGTPEIKREGDRLIAKADIIASTYFLVTRYEEMVRRDVRDKHGRFPGRQSLPYRAGFIDRPIVEEYAALLRKWLREVGVAVPAPKRRFSVLPTHDVDAIRRYSDFLQHLRTVASALLGQQSPKNILTSFGVAAGFKKDPLDTFDEMINLDSRFEEKASSVPTKVIYFFMAGGKSQFDGLYNIRRKVARNTIKMVCDSGATIGLHASYEAGICPELIAKEKTVLEEVCGFPIRHNRHHFLTWREIEEGWALAKAGISWDSTLGYADVAGFRLGVCRPVPLFDPIKIQPFGIEEHPLIVMDCTLSNGNYMNLKEDAAFSYCQKLINQTRKHNGEFVMLWHNTMFVAGQSNYHPKLYRQLLHELNYSGEKK